MPYRKGNSSPYPSLPDGVEVRFSPDLGRPVREWEMVAKCVPREDVFQEILLFRFSRPLNEIARALLRGPIGSPLWVPDVGWLVLLPYNPTNYSQEVRDEAVGCG